MGEFARVLPDYHKPDIMTLITSYMGTVGGGVASGRAEGKVELKQQVSKNSGRYIPHPLAKVTGLVAKMSCIIINVTCIK